MHRLLLIRILLYPTLILLTTAVPYLLWTAELPFIGNTYGNHVEHFELLGFFGTGALLVFAAVELWNKRPVTLDDAIPILAAVLVGTFFMELISEYPGRSWDYSCYEQAAQRIVVDANPYGSCYIYPPLPAQVLAAAYITTGWIAALLHVRVEDTTRWEQVYYGYQCMQIFLLLSSYFLCYRFARTLGLSSVHASILTATLFLVSNPIFRTIRYHQVNFWILDAFLLAALLICRYSLISGIAVAIAAHIKLYPVVMFGIWTVTRQWRAAAASLLATLFITVLQTKGGQDWTLWKWFLDAFRRFTTVMVVQVTDLRNVSIRGAVYQTLRLAELAFPAMRGDLTEYVDYVVAAITAVTGVWFVFRVFQREFIYQRIGALSEAAGDRWQQYRWYGHTMDAAAFAILISPLVWEHHFVVALPIALWAYVTRRHDRPWLIGLATFAIFCMPTFSLYPLAYHRLAGLLLLLWLTRPTAVRLKWVENQSLSTATIGTSLAPS